MRLRKKLAEFAEDTSLARAGRDPCFKNTLFPMNISHQIAKTVVMAVASFALLTGSAPLASAAPTDEIRAAVEASGAKVAGVDSTSFTKAYSSVIVKAKEQELAQYVTAATKLRPDFAPQITAATLRAHHHAGNEAAGSCDWVNAIVRAAVTANPAAAAPITKAAVAAEPASRKCIVAAAIAAAPDQRVAIEQAAGASSGRESASFRPAGIDAGNINNSAAGTINPANMSAQGTAVSPENEDRQTICHNGKNTLTLPRKAAEAHLRQHPGDYPGACH